MKELILREEYDLVKLMAYVKGLFDVADPKPLSVIIDDYDPHSSNAQKRLYWKWIDIMSKHTGNHKINQDEMLRKIFLTPVFYKNNKGKDMEYINRISDIGKKDMAEYMTQVSVMASEHGIDLPHPTDQQRSE